MAQDPLYAEDMSDAEVAQLVAAMEESIQTAKQEAEARKVLQVRCHHNLSDACTRVRSGLMTAIARIRVTYRG